MSRIAKFPVTLPKGVEATLAAEALAIKGPLGTLSQRLRSDVSIEKDGDKLVFKALEDSDEANAMSGTLRALAANMVLGVRSEERRVGKECRSAWWPWRLRKTYAVQRGREW